MGLSTSELSNESTRPDWRRALKPALLGWLAARLFISIAYVVSRFLEQHFESSHDNVTNGLFMWDGGHYRALVDGWYSGAPEDTARFFPLYPALARAVAWLPGISGDAALLIVAHVGAFGAVVVVWLLVQDVFSNSELSDRTAILISVFPAAYVLTLAYTESLAIFAVAFTLLHLHRQNWWWVASGAFLAACLRPTGGLIAVAVLVEIIRLRPWNRIGPAIAALTAAPLGLVGSMWIISLSTHDFWAPVTLQRPIRGPFQDPLTRSLQTIWWTFRDDWGHGYDAFFVVLFVTAVVLMIRYRHPLSWILYSVATLVLIMSSFVVTSVGRYGMVAVPLVIVLAQWAHTRVRAVVMLSTSSLVFTGLAVAAFMSWTVP